MYTTVRAMTASVCVYSYIIALAYIHVYRSVMQFQLNVVDVMDELPSVPVRPPFKIDKEFILLILQNSRLSKWNI